MNLGCVNTLMPYLVHRSQGDLAVQRCDFCVSEGGGKQHAAPHRPGVSNVQLHAKRSALRGHKTLGVEK